MVLLLDFDGTLAPIVERPELAAMPEATRRALDRLMARPGLEVAIVSGRGMADARERAAIAGIAYAGNHGMEIEGPGINRIHPEAAAARPVLERAAAGLRAALDHIEGAFVEDKELTLSVHFRLVARDRVEELHGIVRGVADPLEGVHLTEGKQVIEVRPNVDWNKGKAVLFLLEQMRPPSGAPILFFGDDRTDEDAFRALADVSATAEGVLVAEDAPADTAATSFVHTPVEVGEVFAALADASVG